MRVIVYRVVLQRTRGKNASRVALMSAGRARARRAAAISFSTDGTGNDPRRRVRSSVARRAPTLIRKCVRFSRSRLLLGDDGHEGGNLLGFDLRVLDLLAVAVRSAVLSAILNIARRVRTRERRAARY